MASTSENDIHLYSASCFKRSQLVTWADYFMNLSRKEGGDVFSVVCLGNTLLIYSAVVSLVKNTVTVVKERLFENPSHMCWNTDSEG